MQLPIPDDWDGLTVCRWAVCWPDSPKWKAVLQGLIESPNQGRLWDFSTGSFLGLRGQFRPIYDSNFDLEECIMSCGDSGLKDIAEALKTLAVAQGSCCAGQGQAVQGGIPDGSGGVIPWYGEPPVEVPGIGYPDGYESLEEYLQDKCRVSNMVVDGLSGTLRQLQFFDLVNFTGLLGVLGLAGFGIIALPVAAIPIVAGALVALAATSYLLDSMADYIQDNRDEWVCALYGSDTVEIAVETLAGLADAAIIAIPIPVPAAPAIKAILVSLCSSTTLNKLFSYVAGVGYPDADCSGCEDCDPNAVVVKGSIIGESEGTIQVSPVLEAGLYRVEVYWNVVETSPGEYAFCHFPGVQLTGVSTTNNLLAMTVASNPTGSVIDNAHFYPPNSNLPVFPYSGVGSAVFAFNSGQTGTITLNFSQP